MRLAQRFIAGAMHINTGRSPVGTADAVAAGIQPSLRDYGAPAWPAFPAMNRWAMLGGPYGTQPPAGTVGPPSLAAGTGRDARATASTKAVATHTRQRRNRFPPTKYALSG